MTSEEIRAAIERLETMEPSDYVGVGDVANVVWKFAGDMVPAVELRYTLINLLRQADPKTHIELPKDADGEVINVGDVVKTGRRRGVVYEISTRVWSDLSGHMVYVRSGGEVFYVTPDSLTHYRPTVEDVLTEFSERVLGSCHQWGLEASETIAEYAAKLRELMADE